MSVSEVCELKSRARCVVNRHWSDLAKWLECSVMQPYMKAALALPSAKVIQSFRLELKKEREKISLWNLFLGA